MSTLWALATSMLNFKCKDLPCSTNLAIQDEIFFQLHMQQLVVILSEDQGWMHALSHNLYILTAKYMKDFFSSNNSNVEISVKN